jgi:fructose/tagatose bisphosphate aldolase
METLRKILEEADRNAVAVGHFNISDLVTLKAVFEAARELNVPVIVGVSEGERQFMGVRQSSEDLRFCQPYLSSTKQLKISNYLYSEFRMRMRKLRLINRRSSGQ